VKADAVSAAAEPTQPLLDDCVANTVKDHP
jgi:hypothetical protein